MLVDAVGLGVIMSVYLSLVVQLLRKIVDGSVMCGSQLRHSVLVAIFGLEVVEGRSIRLLHYIVFFCFVGVLDEMMATMLFTNVWRRRGSENPWFWHSLKRKNCGNFRPSVS